MTKFKSLKVMLIGTIVAVMVVASLGVLSGPTVSAYSPEVEDVYAKLLADQGVIDALAFIESDQDTRIAEQIVICEIPAPPFNEQLRAADYMARMIALGLEDVHIDDEGNVIGYRPGTGDGPKLVVAAHLDTVFPLGYDATVTEEEGILYAPGIGDDSGGLAALLSVVRALNDSEIATVGDIMFVGDVGEEGRGDLRGVKNLFSEHEDIDGFISIDGSGTTGITYLGLGSKRYEFTYNGAGGHSWGAFGIPSPIHAMGRSIAKIADMKVPTDPRTSFTVSVVNGGTAINAIAAEVVMQTDTRSVDPVQLEITVAELLAYVEQGVVEENARWGISTTPGLDKTPPGLGDDGPPGLDIANPPGLDIANPPGLRLPDEWAEEYRITVDINMVGDRPSGTCSPDAIHVQVAQAATEAIGAVPRLGGPSSTDSNIPIFLGVPALTLGGGGSSGRGHSPDEWFDPTNAYLGPQRILLTVFGLVGVDGVTAPLLPPGPEYHYEFLGVEVPDMYKP